MVTSRFTTGTATVAVFDPHELNHRRADDCDWWSIPEDELAEINAGRVLFAGLSVDGTYNVRVSTTRLDLQPSVSALLRCSSGRFLVGSGESVPGGGLPANDRDDALAIAVQPGVYLVTVTHNTPGTLDVEVLTSDQLPVNSFSESPSLPWPASPTVALPYAEADPMTVTLDPNDWARCPACNFRFRTSDLNAFANGRHARCGQRLILNGQA